MKTRMFACAHEKCYKSFRSQESLDEHCKDHSGSVQKDPKDYTCAQCGRVLSTKQSLKEHTYTHLGKKYFRCSEIGCGKTFKQSSQLCNHRKVHKEARQMVKTDNRLGDPKILKLDELDSIFQEWPETLSNEDDFLCELPPINASSAETVLPTIDLLNMNN